MTSGNSGDRWNVQRKKDRIEYRPLRDAGTGFADRRTGLVDTDEQTTLGKVRRYPVKRCSSDTETILKSIDKGGMVDGVKAALSSREIRIVDLP